MKYSLPSPRTVLLAVVNLSAVVLVYMVVRYVVGCITWAERHAELEKARENWTRHWAGYK